MLKHVGKHKDKKIVLLYREVPGEDHMCLVSYSDALPGMLHDEIMRVLESDSGQQSQSLSDALYRHIMPDGRNCLEALHTGGFIKKIATEQVLVTPNNKSSVRLDELNRLLGDMEKGKAAAQDLKKIKQEPAAKTRKSAPEPGLDLLSDSDLADQRRQQAEAMKADAARLLKEAQALLAEADELDPSVKNVPTTKKKTKVKAS